MKLLIDMPHSGFKFRFFGFPKVIVSVIVFKKKLTLNRNFQNLSHGTMYFSVAQKIVDFVIFTSLSDHGKV